MQGISSHIISKFRWDTSFDQKEKAPELQERLSGWSRLTMQKEIMEIFDKICPPGQTWKIDLLELNLGIVDYADLEFELGIKLKQQLEELLIDLIIYANKNGRTNIEILNEDASHISILRSFLLDGIMPWNYKPTDGSLNQIMIQQLQSNRRQVIAMLRELAVTHEQVIRRVAWQINDPGIIKIIEGLEPNNHTQIIDFSAEMTKIQMKETIVQASTIDFKKNLWVWILNYLLKERGTIFNKVAFMRSSIRQMADHYNISYQELFELIERAVEAVRKTSGIKSGFLLTLQALSKENTFAKEEVYVIEETNTELLERLKFLFRNPALRRTPEHKSEFNELVAALSAGNSPAVRDLLSELELSGNSWTAALNDLSDTSAEALALALHPSAAAVITESVYFLHRLFKKANRDVKRKMVWTIALEFLQQQKNTTFSNSTFLKYCMSALSEKSKLPEEELFQQLLVAEVSSRSKTTSALEIYTELSSVVVAELAGKPSSFFSGNFKAVLEALGSQLSAGSVDKELFRALQRSVLKTIQLQPKEALEILIAYADKETLRKIVPYILNDTSIALFVKQAKREPAKALELIGNVLSELRAEKRSIALVAAIDSLLLATAVEVLIFHSATSQTAFIELMLEELSVKLSLKHTEEFSLFIGRLLRDEKVQLSGMSIATAQALNERYAAGSKQNTPERVSLLIKTSANKQQEVAGILKADFSGKAFTQVRAEQKKQAEIVLDYLVSGGKQLMDKLLNDYTTQLKISVNKYAAKEIEIILVDLFWKCILDYNNHKGKPQALKTIFAKAVAMRFPEQEKIFSPTGISSSSGMQKRDYKLRSGIIISQQVLSEWIAQCLREGITVLEKNGKKIYLRELINVVAETEPAALQKIISQTAHSQKQIRTLKKVIAFEKFTLLIAGSRQPAMRETMQTVRSLYELFRHIAPASVIAQLLDDCWIFSVQLIAGKLQAATGIKKLVAAAVYKLSKEMDINARSIFMQIKKNNIRLSPELKVLLSESVPAFETLTENELTLTPRKELAAAESRGLLEELSRAIILQTEIPAWLETGASTDVEELLNELIVHYPAAFLQVLRQEVIPEQQMNRLSRSVNFKELIRSIGRLEKSKESLLNIMEGFYYSLGKIAVKGIAASEIQELLFRKILKAWTSGNWRIISTESIWNELVWDLSVKKGVAKKDFFAEIERTKVYFPPSLQAAFEQLREREKQSAPAPVITAEKPVPVKQGAPVLKKQPAAKIAKGGIIVKNAGVVLISSYIEMLFERLGQTLNKKFKDEAARLDAPHYLQFVVTGLSNTGEQLLPLNKVLCGLPLSEPLREGITITDEHKKLIEGLLKAMIGYWPAIGNCSNAGFRGNWLVRDGLLTEQDDRWELTVEKRPYDVLIHQSPFSFSVIKFPWMEKPLHVSWAY